MTTSIEINDLRLYCRHGVFTQEREIGNHFSVSLRLYYPVAEEIADTDELSLTLNYAEVIDIVKEIMNEPVKLLETLAMKIKGTLIERYHEICGGMIRIEKSRPPISNIELSSVAVCVEW